MRVNAAGGWVRPLVLAIWHRAAFLDACRGAQLDGHRRGVFRGALGPHLMAFGWNTGHDSAANASTVCPDRVEREDPRARDRAHVPRRGDDRGDWCGGLAGKRATSFVNNRGARARDRHRLHSCAVRVDPGRPSLAIYDTLRDLPGDGVVLELPVGTLDGFSGEDFSTIACSRIRRFTVDPSLAGWSRLSPAVTRAYRDDPLIDTLLDLSEGRTLQGMWSLSEESKQRVAEQMRADGIRFVMLNRETAPQELIAFAQSYMPLVLEAEEGQRSLYVVK